jgi:FixJ family two-component response regulator
MNAIGTIAKPTVVVVHVVEADESSRAASVRLLTSVGHVVRGWASAAEFLAQLPSEPGCIVLDLRLPGASGFEVQERVVNSQNPLPVVFLTAHGDVPKTVRAMKAGAVDFLTKPVEAQTLLDAVERALAHDAENRARRSRRLDVRTKFERLTPREREVFAHLISGQLNKQIGFDLGITERTIKVHRHQVLGKLEAGSIVDLVRIAGDLDIAPIKLR